MTYDEIAAYEGLLKRLSKIGHAPNLQAYLRQCEEEARKG